MTTMILKAAGGHASSGIVTLVLLAWGVGASWIPLPLAGRLDAALRGDGLNRIDLEQRERGYYEQLLDSGRNLGGAPAAGAQAAGLEALAGAPFHHSVLTLMVSDVRETVLKPSFTIDDRGKPWTTNAQGMRDREYSLEKPAGTLRLALLGDSIGAAWGAADGEGFEPLLEEALGRAASARGSAGGVEIWNYAVPGHAPGQRYEHFVRQGGWDRRIDAVLYEATPADIGWDAHRLRRALPLGWGFDSTAYGPTLANLGFEPGWSIEAYKRRLRPYRWELLEGVYRAVVRDCRERGVPSVWFLLPRVGKAGDAEDCAHLVRLAREAGFDVVIDATDVFDGVAPERLAVAPDDYHPNAEGHARLARRLAEALPRHAAWTRLMERAAEPVARTRILEVPPQ
jgi:hypothetical protein